MHFCQSVHPDTPVVVYSDLAYTSSHDSIAKSDPWEKHLLPGVQHMCKVLFVFILTVCSQNIIL